jgi:hypothetical protein
MQCNIFEAIYFNPFTLFLSLGLLTGGQGRREGREKEEV